MWGGPRVLQKLVRASQDIWISGKHSLTIRHGISYYYFIVWTYLADETVKVLFWPRDTVVRWFWYKGCCNQEHLGTSDLEITSTLFHWPGISHMTLTYLQGGLGNKSSSHVSTYCFCPNLSWSRHPFILPSHSTYFTQERQPKIWSDRCFFLKSSGFLS